MITITPPLHATDHPPTGHEATAHETGHSSPPKLSAPIPGDYGRHRAAFSQICTLLKEDGRSDLIAKLVEPLLAKNNPCLDCRPLATQLFNPCRPPPEKKSLKKKKKQPETPEEEPTPEPTATPAPQAARFPQLGILDLWSDLSRKLMTESQAPEQTAQAMEQLRSVFRQAAPVTAAERDYLNTLIAFIGTNEGAVPVGHGSVKARATPSIDGLFERPSFDPTPDFSMDEEEDTGPQGFR